MTLDKKITLCENLTPVEVRIGNYIMNLEPLITEVTRFLGTDFYRNLSYQAIPAVLFYILRNWFRLHQQKLSLFTLILISIQF